MNIENLIPTLPADINKHSSFVDYSPFIKHRSPLKSPCYINLDDRSFSAGITFPEPLKDHTDSFKEYRINMMPFILNESLDTLPEECKRYKDIILRCLYETPTEKDRVCYLTIEESYVKKGTTQRRPGLHTETIGMSKNSGFGTYYHYPPSWGGAYGGIFLASNIGNSTRVYNAYVDDTVIGTLGDIEHLRKTLDKNFDKSIMEPNSLYWLTDRTPHEALPIQEDSFRQFFRLVTSDVSLWYSKHSTWNPLCAPAAEIVDIDKFEFLKNYKEPKQIIKMYKIEIKNAGWYRGFISSEFSHLNNFEIIKYGTHYINNPKVSGYGRNNHKSDFMIIKTATDNLEYIKGVFDKNDGYEWSIDEWSTTK
jgi:hypothetical protein